MNWQPCLLEDCRSFDPETREWVYSVVCFREMHRDRTCPGEHEMFRRPQ